MKLYLVQHAEAKSKEEDPERPLSDRGWAETRTVAAYVAEHGDIEVDQIYHSGKARARQTAEALAAALHPAKGIDQADDLAPLAEAAVWAARLADMTDDVMLVGHLPHLSKLAGLLLCQDEDNSVVAFQMGGIVCLSQAQSDDWSVRWMVTPEIVG
ncbi:MAG TPA: phosphohistidine phosphatase SixA [Anaerolineae bacterium]